MGRLTKNFKRSEFTCECGCGAKTIDFRLITIMQETCDHFANILKIEKVVAIVTGGNRCRPHNKKVQEDRGLPDNDSAHCYFWAADWAIKGVSPQDLYAYLDKTYKSEIGLGLYNNRVHLDTRGYRARWDTTV